MSEEITPAEAARFVLDRWLPHYRRWAKETFLSPRTHRVCLGTALVLASGISMDEVVDRNKVDHGCVESLAGVPEKVMLTTAELIRNEFPERLHYLESSAPVKRVKEAETLIIEFNDDEATRYEDVRLIMEKMAAA